VRLLVVPLFVGCAHVRSSTLRDTQVVRCSLPPLAEGGVDRLSDATVWLIASDQSVRLRTRVDSEVAGRFEIDVPREAVQQGIRLTLTLPSQAAGGLEDLYLLAVRADGSCSGMEATPP
jgi:hypothetical protein